MVEITTGPHEEPPAGLAYVVDLPMLESDEDLLAMVGRYVLHA